MAISDYEDVVRSRDESKAPTGTAIDPAANSSVDPGAATGTPLTGVDPAVRLLPTASDRCALRYVHFHARLGAYILLPAYLLLSCCKVLLPFFMLVIAGKSGSIAQQICTVVYMVLWIPAIWLHVMDRRFRSQIIVLWGVNYREHKSTWIAEIEDLYAGLQERRAVTEALTAHAALPLVLTRVVLAYLPDLNEHRRPSGPRLRSWPSLLDESYAPTKDDHAPAAHRLYLHNLSLAICDSKEANMLTADRRYQESDALSRRVGLYCAGHVDKNWRLF